jgi:hypothetical protein
MLMELRRAAIECGRERAVFAPLAAYRCGIAVQRAGDPVDDPPSSAVDLRCALLAPLQPFVAPRNLWDLLNVSQGLSCAKIDDLGETTIRAQPLTKVIS